MKNSTAWLLKILAVLFVVIILFSVIFFGVSYSKKQYGSNITVNTPVNVDTPVTVNNPTNVSVQITNKAEFDNATLTTLTNMFFDKIKPLIVNLTSNHS